ncbi:MAG: pilus (MSHA type) biogenesis protein MshL [Methylophilaceae bacterium]|nr:pilus (MSHA type) biogenesis protein MshL [Methylophilaceae bacterium]
MNKTWISLLAISGAFVLTSCAHQSKVTPSTGHIDGQSPAQQTQASATPAPSDIPKPVTSITYLPPPTPKPKEQTYSVVVNEVPVKEILFALARESNLNIDIHPAIQGRVTLNAVDQTLPAILERLSKQVDLTYKVEGNVLNITPDHPVLRTYKIDYVNMSRDTTGSVGVASEIASTGRAASTGTSGSSSGGPGSGGGASTTNSSRTLVSSESKNRFWETLIGNIKDILSETDKEVIITREGSTSRSTESAGGAIAGEQQQAAVSQTRDLESERQQARTEYKTLFAATVIANPEAGIINVRGTNKQHAKIQEFLDQVMSSAKRQVLIEATIVEVELSDSFQAGIDWQRLNTGSSGFQFQQTLGPNPTFDTATGALIGVGENALGQNTTAGIIAGYLNPVSRLGNIAASLTLLKQFGNTKVLSSPKLMVLNNQTAVLKVVDNLVYFTAEAQISQATVAGGGNLQSVTTTPHTVPVGVVMSVTPQIADTGTVNINVRPTISRVLDFVRDPNPLLSAVPSLVPRIQVQEMESMLQINTGSTAVLGGLMQDQVSRNSDKVPGLGDIPVLGKAFTGKNDANKKTELVIFLRPTIIKNASLESDELQSYKQYLPSQQLQQSLDESAY